MHTKGQVSYIDEGEGDIILFLHGNPDTAEMWRPSIKYFSSSYRCIAPDLPGFGNSVISKNFGCSLEEYVEWVQVFLDDLQVSESVHLVVHDLGGPVGLSWAIEYSSLVRSICVTNSLYFSDYSWHFWAGIWRTPFLGELSNFLMTKWIYDMEVRRGGPLLTRDHKDKTYDQINPIMKSTVLRMYRAFSPEVFRDWEDRYIQLTKDKKVLVVWGAKDPYIPMRFGFAERFSQGQECIIIPESGHWVTAEVPVQFNKALATFLSLED